MSETDQEDAHEAQTGPPAGKKPLWTDTQGGYRQARTWKSSISWRITVAVFLTLLLVETVSLILTVPSYEAAQLAHVRNKVYTALIFSMHDTRDRSESPLTERAAARLIKNSWISGLAVYRLDGSLVRTYGAPPALKIAPGRGIPPDWRSEDDIHYDTVYMAAALGHPYNVVAGINASVVRTRVISYVRQSLKVLLLTSIVVTSVLMIVLSMWLLEPILLLRNNLLSAARNPEKPDIQEMRKELYDEVGITIRVANDLIRQNASSLKRLRTQAEDRIHRLAYFDALTGLPNRAYFLEQLEDIIKSKVLAEDEVLAVMAVDIDHFKDINDTMGHDIGDKMLEAIGKRLVKALPERAVIARASADEFTIMAVMDAAEQGSAALAEKIFAIMSEPVSIMQESFQVRVSIGVSHYPADGETARQILKNADISLNRAKEDGRDTVRYYSQEFDAAVHYRFQMLRDLRNAVNRGELQVYYHPQFELKTGRIVGAEALLRWWLPDNSKEGGQFISPAEFIPVAEQAGLIVPIGEFVLRTACATNVEWQKKGLPPFRVAINLSGVQFHRGDIVGLVDTVLQETGLDARWLELEVTESVFMENMESAVGILQDLHSLGVEIAVDDFGTGYSSLSYLREFPIDRLKIDQSFIRNALINADDRMITRTIVTLGHSLNLKVIAEGVETVEHENFLRELDCDEVQGFKYTQPIPAEKFYNYAVDYYRQRARSGKLIVVE